MLYSQFAALFDRIKQTSTRYAEGIRITRKDGTIFRYTSHDKPLIVPGDGTYEIANSFEISALEQEHGFTVSNANFRCLLEDETIPEEDLAKGLFDDAIVELFVIYWSRLSLGTLPLKYGWIGDVVLENTSFNAEFRGISDKLAQIYTETLSLSCRSPFGGKLKNGIGRCGFDLTTVETNYTVSSVASPDQFFINSSVANNIYRWGLATWLTGDNAGLEMEVLRHELDRIGLFLPMTYDIQVGDTLKLAQGCDKQPSTCRTYLQILNFDGEPYITGSDSLQVYPDAKIEDDD